MFFRNFCHFFNALPEWSFGPLYGFTPNFLGGLLACLICWRWSYSARVKLFIVSNISSAAPGIPERTYSQTGDFLEFSSVVLSYWFRNTNNSPKLLQSISIYFFSVNSSEFVSTSVYSWIYKSRFYIDILFIGKFNLLFLERSPNTIVRINVLPLKHWCDSIQFSNLMFDNQGWVLRVNII